MRVLLIKELRLSVAPLTRWFLLFSLMTLVPFYPILISAILICLGLLFSFQCILETGDLLYTLLLPIRKRDVVRGKYWMCVVLELGAFALMAALTALRMLVLRELPVYVENVMMAANPFFLAFVLLIFAAFNTSFLGSFFQTADRIGRPFFRFLIPALLLAMLGEALHFIPALAFLNDSAGARMWMQYTALAVAAGLYALLTFLSMRTAEARFDSLDYPPEKRS